MWAKAAYRAVTVALDEMLVHQRLLPHYSTTQHLAGCPKHFSSTHLYQYTWVEQGCQNWPAADENYHLLHDLGWLHVLC